MPYALLNTKTKFLNFKAIVVRSGDLASVIVKFPRQENLFHLKECAKLDPLNPKIISLQSS